MQHATKISDNNPEGLGPTYMHPTFYMISRNVSKYSFSFFYVAATKNNKFDFEPYLELGKYIAI